MASKSDLFALWWVLSFRLFCRQLERTNGRSLCIPNTSSECVTLGIFFVAQAKAYYVANARDNINKYTLGAIRILSSNSDRGLPNIYDRRYVGGLGRVSVETPSNLMITPTLPVGSDKSFGSTSLPLFPYEIHGGGWRFVSECTICMVWLPLLKIILGQRLRARRDRNNPREKNHSRISFPSGIALLSITPR